MTVAEGMQKARWGHKGDADLAEPFRAETVNESSFIATVQAVAKT